MLDILWRRGVMARLRQVRIRQGMTQAQCAEAMGVTLARLQEIENAEFPNPYVATLARYARALGAELEFSIHEKPDLTEPGDQSADRQAAEDAHYADMTGVDEDEQYGVPA